MINYAVFVTLRCDDVAQAQANAPDEVRAHLARVRDFQATGKLQLAVVYRGGHPPLCTLAMFTIRLDAEDFAQGDPFVFSGIAEEWHIEECGDLLATHEASRQVAQRMGSAHVAVLQSASGPLLLQTSFVMKCRS
jgi:hypothetical protein